MVTSRWIVQRVTYAPEPYGRFSDQTTTFVGPFDSRQEAADWAAGCGTDSYVEELTDPASVPTLTAAQIEAEEDAEDLAAAEAALAEDAESVPFERVLDDLELG
jgi:hypothetical protein